MTHESVNLLKRYRAHLRELVTQGWWHLAERVIAQILAIDPIDPDANRYMVVCLAKRGDLDRALEQAKFTLSIQPDKPAPMTALGSVYLDQGDLESAKSHFRRALEFKPDHLPALHLLAEASVRGRCWDDALEWAIAGLSHKPRHHALLRIKARALAAVGRTEDAISTLHALLDLYPDHAQSHATAGFILRAARRLDEAALHLRNALQINPADAEVHKQMGLLLRDQNEFEQAQYHFEQTLHFAPGNAAATAGLRELQFRRLQPLLKERKFNAYEAAVRTIRDGDPSNPIACAEHARALLLLRQYDAALATALQAVEIDNECPLAHLILGYVHFEMEHHKDALKEAEIARSMSLRSSDARLLAASVHIDLEEYPQALEHIEDGQRLEPNHRPLCRARAVCMAGLRDAAAAEAAMEKAIAADEQEDSLLLMKGRAFHLLGRLEEAVSTLQRLPEDNPFRFFADLYLGLIYLEQHRHADAEPMLVRALKANPHLRRARAGLKEIRSGKP